MDKIKREIHDKVYKFEYGQNRCECPAVPGRSHIGAKTFFI